MITDAVAQWNAAERAAGVSAEHHSFFRPASPGAPASQAAPAGRGERRALLVHGAGGSPADFHKLAAFLTERGWTVLCPLLPGHGRDPVALGDVRFRDLVGTVLQAHDLLREDGPAVAVVAQSLGAVLAVHLAVRHPVRALVALAPALRPFVLRRLWLLAVGLLVKPRLAAATWKWQTELLRGIRETRSLLADVRCPLLVLHSRDDASVSPRGGAELHAGVGSPVKRYVELDGQGHVLSIAPDKEKL
ncbi:MAG TPA: alpha/beta fold hydrolase, partial [bacterium]|nr:alpha/beta fold hydrolase [bacterium]